jgi:hypothetical protein
MEDVTERMDNPLVRLVVLSPEDYLILCWTFLKNGYSFGCEQMM